MASLRPTNPAARVAAVTLVLLLVPAIAMQFSDQVSWGPVDFVAAAALLFGAGMTYSLLARRVRTMRRRVALGAAVALVLATAWAELAVGLLT